MEVVVGFAWFFGSLYALISLFRPLPPFRKRTHAALGLAGVQVLVVIAAGVLVAGTPTPNAVPPAAHSQPQPQAVPEQVSSGDPSYLVRTKPGEKMEIPVAAPGEVAAFQQKAKAGLKTLDAAEAVIINAVEAGRVDLIRDARNAAQEVSLAMIADRQKLAGTIEGDSAIPCQRAASGLAAFAGSILNDGQETAAVRDRLRMSDEYQEDRDKCELWLG